MGDQMSPSLKERVKTALSYLQAHQQTKVIVTGEKDPMKKFLKQRQPIVFCGKKELKRIEL